MRLLLLLVLASSAAKGQIMMPGLTSGGYGNPVQVQPQVLQQQQSPMRAFVYGVNGGYGTGYGTGYGQVQQTTHQVTTQTRPAYGSTYGSTYGRPVVYGQRTGMMAGPVSVPALQQQVQRVTQVRTLPIAYSG